MANNAHLAAIQRGPLHYHQWRSSHPHEILDLSGAQLAGIDLQGLDLGGAVLDDANLIGAIIHNTNFAGASLRRADLRGAQANQANFTNAILTEAVVINVVGVNGHFSDADLTKAKFTNSNLTGGTFKGATIIGAQFEATTLSGAIGLPTKQLRECSSLAGVVLNRVDLSDVDLSGVNLPAASLVGCSLYRANLRGAHLVRAHLTDAQLVDADLTGCNLTQAHCGNADFYKAQLISAKLTGGDFKGAKFGLADVADAEFSQATLDGASFGQTKHVDRALGLDRTLVQQEILYFDTLEFSFLNGRVGWENLRAIGRLPLFGASYSALIAIPFFYFGLEYYNEHVDLMRAWATQQLQEPGPHAFAAVVDSRLHRVPIPTRSLWILFAAIALGIASTIYALACPPRVKEFSKDQWRDELGRPAFHYVSHSWQTPYWRVIAMGFFLFGGIAAALLILEKLGDVFWIIIRNT